MSYYFLCVFSFFNSLSLFPVIWVCGYVLFNLTLFIFFRLWFWWISCPVRAALSVFILSVFLVFSGSRVLDSLLAFNIEFCIFCSPV